MTNCWIVAVKHSDTDVVRARTQPSLLLRDRLIETLRSAYFVTLTLIGPRGRLPGLLRSLR
jgi:hypothetical protein